MTIIYDDIKKCIDEWDPINLLNTHAPVDEYDNESKKIFNRLSKLPLVNSQKLSEIIYEVFIESFGSDVFILNISACQKIAEKIIFSKWDNG